MDSKSDLFTNSRNVAVCTYCSAHKSDLPEHMPAIERYQSERIFSINRLASWLNVPFFILSGKFGLISAQEKIPWYDHLLSMEEVHDHVQLVTEQLKELEISDLIFVGESVENDPNLAAYYQCIQSACKEVGIGLIFEHFSN